MRIGINIAAYTEDDVKLDSDYVWLDTTDSPQEWQDAYIYLCEALAAIMSSLRAGTDAATLTATLQDDDS
jgi:hypothetical protein